MRFCWSLGRPNKNRLVGIAEHSKVAAGRNRTRANPRISQGTDGYVNCKSLCDTSKV
jgi:hypothetical protein